MRPAKSKGWIWATAFSLCAAVCLVGCGRAPSPDMGIILADKPAPLLSDYGLFEDAAARTPSAGVLKYDLINPLFSDHADKHRYVYVPDGQAAGYTESDILDFPVGTVLVKSFAYGTHYLETRLLIHKSDGWEAIPYLWNADGTEAQYAPVGKRIEIAAGVAAPSAPGFTYSVPNKNQCKTCHQSGDAVMPIGPKARNLNHMGPAGINQLTDWQTRGILAAVPGAPPAVPAIVDTDNSLDKRARAYLDINCAHCHKSTGSASNSGLWLDWEETELVKLGFGKHPTAAGRGSGKNLVVIAAGDPDASILASRMASQEPGVAMPELGRALPDADGVALIREWIANHSEAEES